MTRREVGVFALALVSRLAFLALAGTPPSNYYWRVSDGLLFHGTLADQGVRTARYEPLYPVFLAVTRWLTGDELALVQLLQIVVGALGAVLLYRLTLRLSASPTAATVAAVLYATYPYLVRQSVAWMELTVFSTLVLAAVYAFERVAGAPSALVCGAAFGLAILTRASILPLWLLAVADLAIRGKRQAAGLVAAAALLILAPALVRNYRVDGSLVPTRNGENLCVGNFEYSDRIIPTYDVDFFVPRVEDLAYARAGLDPSDATEATGKVVDDMEARMALEFIRAHPWRTLKLKLLNVLYVFHPRIVPLVPWGPEGRVTFLPDGSFRVEGARARPLVQELAHTVVYAATALAALGGLLLRRRTLGRDRFLLLTVLTFVVVQAVYFPTTRLRVPADFVLMFYAGCAASRAMERR